MDVLFLGGTDDGTHSLLSITEIVANRGHLSDHVCRRGWRALSSECFTLSCDTAARKDVVFSEEEHATCLYLPLSAVAWWLGIDQIGRKMGRKIATHEVRLH